MKNPDSGHNYSANGQQFGRRRFNRLAFGAGLAGLGACCGLTGSNSALGASPLWTAAPDRKASPNEKSPAELITAETQRAIDKGLEFLNRNQIKTGRKRGAFGNNGYAAGVATCSLGGLAFMCGGSAPGEGRYGKSVDMCVEYVMSNVSEEGYIARRDNNPNETMYGHGFSMLFLSQAYGMTRRAGIGEKLRLAVELTCKTQNNDGGWRYQPRKNDADLSITVCQIMGLRGARDAGIDVPDDVRTKCIEYVKKSQNKNGSFRYTLRGGHTTFAMTAAGVTSLYSAGIYDGEQVETALEYLAKFKPGNTGSHFFYSNYYAVQAMWHAGGEYWNNWYPEIRDYLIKKQNNDGSWQSDHAGHEYGTAMACIILQMPLNYLPVFSA